ncbi:MAG: twin-arginine translocase subunit TatC [Coriobacteriia bacterium]|nr:twin-arginine translocase subunit TatC [Coriobacteriia bacterium]
MPVAPKRLPFFEHLAELRRRIVIIAVAVTVASSVLYIWAWEMLGFLLKPVLPYIGGGIVDGQLVLPGPFDPFTFRFKVALYAALVITSPVIIWQILAFFLPALKPKEQRYFIPTFFAAVVLFLAGNVFCYQVILGTAIEWMVGQVGGPVTILPDAAKYLSGVTLLMLGFGLAFEIPIVIFYLVAFNIVPYRKMRKNWRTAYVILMVVASIATPDWSPVTMGLLFVALLGLYEVSLGLARLLLVKRIAAQRAAEDEV